MDSEMKNKHFNINFNISRDKGVSKFFNQRAPILTDDFFLVKTISFLRRKIFLQKPFVFSLLFKNENEIGLNGISSVRGIGKRAKEKFR